MTCAPKTRPYLGHKEAEGFRIHNNMKLFVLQMRERVYVLMHAVLEKFNRRTPFNVTPNCSQQYRNEM